MTTRDRHDDPAAARIRALTRSVTAPPELRAAVARSAERLGARRARRRRHGRGDGRPGALAREVEGEAFPAWSGPLPWRPSGQRTDRLAGTVSYVGPRRARLAYTIVGGPALAWPEGARRVRRDGVEVHLTRSGGSVVATWRQGGHECVISAPASVPDRAMLALAASSRGSAGTALPGYSSEA